MNAPKSDRLTPQALVSRFVQSKVQEVGDSPAADVGGWAEHFLTSTPDMLLVEFEEWRREYNNRRIG